ARDHFEASGIMRGNLGKRVEAAFVTLHGDHAPRAVRKQRARQPAGAGADFENGRSGQVSRRPGNLRRDVEVEQEVLPERLLGAKLVTFDHVAQRRQPVETHEACALALAMRRASLSAASRLSGRATPLPAMSKAVPWSGEVRMN